MSENDFDFIGDDDVEIATGGNQEEDVEIATGGNQEEDVEIATSGNLDESKIHQGLTAEQIKEAQSLAGSPKGLEIEKFVRKYGLKSLNIDDLLSFQLPSD